MCEMRLTTVTCRAAPIHDSSIRDSSETNTMY